LFAGIGGFSFAARCLGWQTVAFVEKDEFCQKVLRKNFGQDIKIYDDIKQFSGQPFLGTNIITGGFPCQPFSQAGKRKGKDDDRYLWDETLRVVAEAKPDWFVGENVAGIISLALDDVLSDLESEGYETVSFVLPACAVNAPHRRDRVWIIANLQGDRIQESERQTGQSFGSEFIQSGLDVERKDCFVASNTESVGWGDGVAENIGQNKGKIHTSCNQTPRINGIASDSICGKNYEIGRNCECGRHELGRNSQATFQENGQTNSDSFDRQNWTESWIQAATRICGVYDGLPRRLHRTARLKSLGNSIVPQVAYEILSKIQDVDFQRTGT